MLIADCKVGGELLLDCLEFSDLMDESVDLLSVQVLIPHDGLLEALQLRIELGLLRLQNLILLL